MWRSPFEFQSTSIVRHISLQSLESFLLHFLIKSCAFCCLSVELLFSKCCLRNDWLISSGLVHAIFICLFIQADHENGSSYIDSTRRIERGWKHINKHSIVKKIRMCSNRRVTQLPKRLFKTSTFVKFQRQLNEVSDHSATRSEYFVYLSTNVFDIYTFYVRRVSETR